MRPLVVIVGLLLLIVCASLLVRQVCPGLVKSICTAKNNYQKLTACEGPNGTFLQYSKAVDQATGYIESLVLGVLGVVFIVAGTRSSPVQNRKTKQKPLKIGKPIAHRKKNAKAKLYSRIGASPVETTDDDLVALVAPDEDYDDGGDEESNAASATPDDGMNDLIFKNGRHVFKKQPIE